MGSRSQTYQITVRGQLGEGWTRWFDPLAVEVDEFRNATTLTGPVVDQAELRGIMEKIWDLNLAVVSMACLEPEQ